MPSADPKSLYVLTSEKGASVIEKSIDVALRDFNNYLLLKKELDPLTALRYTRRVDAYFNYHLNIHIETICSDNMPSELVGAFLKTLHATRSRDKMHEAQKALEAFYGWLVETGVMQTNPAKDVT